MKKVLIVILALLFSACSPTVALKSSPIPEPIPGVVRSASDKSLHPAVLEETKLTADGNVTNANPAFKDRLLQAIKAAGVFSEVYSEQHAGLPPDTVHLTLSGDEVTGHHTGLNMMKGGIVGLSLYTLSPLIPLYRDYTTSMRLRVERADKEVKTYSTYTQGEVTYHAPTAAFEAWGALTSKASESALKSLSYQLSNDKEWLGK